MDLTKRTLEDILAEVFKSGNLVIIIPCCLVVGLMLGIILTSLYFSKIKYHCLKNELADAKAALEPITRERDDYKAKYEAERERLKEIDGLAYISADTASSSHLLPDSLD